MKCLFCDPHNEYSWLDIREYKHWKVALRNNQNYLGWCIVVLKRHLEDPMEISKEERTELFKITKRLRNVIKDKFKADKINYAFLGNVTGHVHLQVVPRYSKEVVFEDKVFSDLNWGSNYSPCDKEFDVPKVVKRKIIETISNALAS